ncbi:MAG: D-alanine--D-alanine ligase [Myxococcota bacterium]
MSREARVAVLMGGPSSEHEVSMESGRQIADALERQGPTLRVVISPEGAWSFPDGPVSSVGAALDRLAAEAEAVFPALHGRFGEDGTVQALLEVARLPYVGSGVGASALAMDKARAKAIFRAAGLPTPPSAHLRPGDEALVEAAVRTRFPCVVKPSSSGSSCGVTFPKDAKDAVIAVAEHLAEGQDVIVEAVIKGRELTCGVLDYDDGPRALPVTEIIPSETYAFFDYAAKYTPGATSEVTPAEIPGALRDQVQAMAVAAHRALGCRDMSRTDFMIDGGAPTLLETNTLPGFTATSLLPQAAAAAGLDFDALVQHLVRRVLARGRRAL